MSKLKGVVSHHEREIAELSADRDSWRDAAGAAKEHYEQSDARVDALTAEVEQLLNELFDANEACEALQEWCQIAADRAAVITRVREEIYQAVWLFAPSDNYELRRHWLTLLDSPSTEEQTNG